MSRKTAWTTPILIAMASIVMLPTATKAAKPPVIVAGTAWAVQSKEKVKIKGAGLTMEGDITVFYFGPNAAQGLAADEFKGRGPDGTTGHGTYHADAKGKIEMTFDRGDVEYILEGFIEEIADDDDVTISGLDVDMVSQKVTGKVKKGMLQVKFKVKFGMSVIADFEHYESKGKWSFKGSGYPY